MSKRQLFRLKATFRETDLAALSHGNRNRKPPNVLSGETKALVPAKRKRGASDQRQKCETHSEGSECGAFPYKGESGRSAGGERAGSLVQVDATPFE